MPVKPRRMRCPCKGVAIASHCAIVNLLRVVNLLSHSIFSTVGPLGRVHAKGVVLFKRRASAF